MPNVVTKDLAVFITSHHPAIQSAQRFNKISTPKIKHENNFSKNKDDNNDTIIVKVNILLKIR